MNLIPISDLSDFRIAPYCRLTNRELRSPAFTLKTPAGASAAVSVTPPEAAETTTATATSLCICESLFVIQQAFARGLRIQSLLISDNHAQTICQDIPELRESSLPVFVASQEVLSAIAGFSVTRGYFACVERPCRTALSPAALRDIKTLCVLENFRDVSNVGATIRNACALGIDALLLSPECADPYARRAIRTSMGTVFGVPMLEARGRWPEDVAQILAQEGFYLIAAALGDHVRMLQDMHVSPDQKIAVFFGNEGRGLSSSVLACVDQSYMIPMQHDVDSLNVAASSAVFFWQIAQARARS